MELAGVRGRLDVAHSLKTASFPRARAWCVVDELSPDTLPNRIVKTTLRQLAGVDGLDDRLAESLRDLYRRMPGVQEMRVTGQSFRRVTLGSNTSYYGFLLDVCELVHRNLLVDEQTGTTIFRDFTRDDAQMARLFERFLFRFYQKEQHRYRVEAPHLTWRATGDDAALEYLPKMRTDIVLRNGERTIVIDAKYYAETLTEYFGKATVRSGHLYQLFAYLRHLAGGARPAAGVLLYPRTTATVAIHVEVFGHPVLVSTVDLSRPWREVHRDLLGVVASVEAAASTGRCGVWTDASGY